MKSFHLIGLFLLSLFVCAPASAAEVCTVSMMGRVCYEEGSQELTSSHMKGDAVAESNSKKKIETADASKAKK